MSNEFRILDKNDFDRRGKEYLYTYAIRNLLTSNFPLVVESRQLIASIRVRYTYLSVYEWEVIIFVTVVTQYYTVYS